MEKSGRITKSITMLRVTRIVVVILLVQIHHATSNSDSQNSHDQGNFLDTQNDNVNKRNDKNPSNDESQISDKSINTNPSNDESQISDKSINANVQEDMIVDINKVVNANEDFKEYHDDKTDPQQMEYKDLTPNSDKENSQETLVFEDTGKEDEPLVEHMKRLSEKIKKSTESSGIHKASGKAEYEDVTGSGEDTESGKSTSERIQMETVGNIPDVQSVEFEQQLLYDNMKDEIIDEKTLHLHDNHDNHDISHPHKKEKSLTEQMQEEIENVNLPVVESSYDVDEFPEDSVFDLNKPSEHVEVKTEVPISNTLPPSSDINPSQTDIPKPVELKSSVARDMTADEMLATSTPPLDKMNQKQTSIVEKTAIKATTTHDIPAEDTQSSAFLDIKNVGRNHRLEKKRANLNKVDIDSKETQNSGIEESITATKTVTFDQVSTVNVQVIDLYPTQTVKGETDSSIYTEPNNEQGYIVQMDTTDNPPEGTVRETATANPNFMDKKRETVMKQERDANKVVPNTADKASPVKESEVPSMTRTLSDDHTGLEPPTSTTVNGEQPPMEEEPELTETEKQKLAQAQQYFEKGEKLVNNSYKKDYIQAMEYFKLAAALDHAKALEYLGFGHLLGDYIDLDPEKALKIFTELSDKGSPRGQLGLGFCYGSGLAVNSSQAKALIYFTFSALGGDPFAQMVLGYRYLSGIGVESKCETALQFYRKVATTVAETVSSGNPVVQRIRLHEQTENKDNGVSLMDADLLQYYEFLADKGDVQAQVVLGQLYYQGGRGVPVNHERAHHYFLMASESESANALAFLGKMHSEGSPYIKQDNLTAYQYFKKAADKGNPIGLCGMGIMHYHGRGVEKDYTKALRYFSQSADQGWSDGQLQLGLMHYSGKGVKRDYKQAVRYLNLASQGGHVLAFFHMAQMHATGVGVLRNCHTAVELYKNVAERGSWAVMLMEAHQLYKEGNVNEALLKYTFLAELGYEVAQTNVAFILDQGESSLFTEEETYQRALLQWTRAASQGSTVARLKMGDYHYYGYGTEIDYETAASHYRTATEQQNNAQAMFNLGYMHEQGLGLKQDVHLAKRFYDMAAETSGDAYVPVTLALVKLGLLYGFEVFNKELEGYNDMFKRLDIRYSLGPNWDIYVATFLAIALGIVVVLRRQR